MMRIITGKARGTHLETLPGENTRPTAERAKEAIFSALQFEIAGKEVLDLFAGSGQMGLEALSRGASHASFCDLSKDAAKIVEKNAVKTKLLLDTTIYCGDFTDFLRMQRKKKKFDLVFLDPPYAKGLVPVALKLLCEYELLSAGAIVVAETAEEADVFAGDETLCSRFEIFRKSHYGIAKVCFLRDIFEKNVKE